MAVFTLSVFQRYLARRNLAFLYWGIGLLMFGLGSFAEAYLALSWSRAMFLVWWLFGAVLNPAWIGQGTLQLLFRKRWVHVVTVVLIAVSIAASGLVLSSVVNEGQFVLGKSISEQYKTIWTPGAAVRLLPIPFGTYGLVTLVGGALYSGFLLWRKRVLPNRVIGNIMIAVGALAVGGGSVLTGLGFGQYLYLSELVAAMLMYGGFLMASAPAFDPVPEQKPQSASADK
jgi:hypothetical protein